MALAIAVAVSLTLGTVRWYRALGPVTTVPSPSERVRQFGQYAADSTFLDQPLPDNLILSGELRSVLQRLSELTGIAITVEWRTLEQVGAVRPETQCRVDLSGLTVGDGLLKLSASLRSDSPLYWYAGPDPAVQLSALTPAAMRPITVVYDLSDLVAPSERAPFAELSDLAHDALQRIPSLGTFQSTERLTTTVAGGLLTRRQPSRPLSPARLAILSFNGRNVLVVTSDSASQTDFQIHLDTLRYSQRMLTTWPAVYRTAAWSLLWSLPTALLLALPFAERRYRRALARAGCCRACGYDLRASPDRCPECGAPVTKDVQRM